MKRTILIYCLLSFLISWIARLIFCVEDLGWISIFIPKGILQLLASYGPSIAGLIVFYLTYRGKGLLAVMKSLLKAKIHVKWYLFALFFELGSFIVIVIFANITGYRATPFRHEEIVRSFYMFFVNAFILSFLTGLGEEIGWRGFLLPELQSRFPVIRAVIILALVNSLWHLRTDLLSLLLQGDLNGFITGYFPDMAQRIIISIPVVIIMAYLFNKTGGSLLIMVLFHGTANASWEWVKQVTGVSDPSYLLPLWAVLLWLTAIYFIPALKRQAKERELIKSIM